MTEGVDRCPDPQVLVDFALGELTGRARAAALEHLVGCWTCRGEVESLTGLTDRLLLAAPEAEPPIGFESTVLDRIQRGPRRPSRMRRVALVGAAAVIAVLAFLGGRLLRTDAVDIADAAMVTPSGRDVGRVWRYDHDPSWVFVSVPGWEVWDDPDTGTHDYELIAELDDGTIVELGRIAFSPDDGSWGTTIDVDARLIRQVAIVDETGHRWCEGTF